MTTQNHFRRKTLIGFAFLLILNCLRAQVITPPEGSAELQRYLSGNFTENNYKKTERYNLVKELGKYYDSNVAHAIITVLNSEKALDLLGYNLFSLVFTAKFDTDPLPPELLPCAKDTFNRRLGRYFRVDSMPFDGWRLNLDSLASLINPPEGSGHAKAKELFLIPVMKPLTRASSCNNNISSSHVTIVVAGIDIHNNIIYRNGKPILYEYLKPCPNNCPIEYKKLFKKN